MSNDNDGKETIKTIIKAHAQPNFMIGIGYVRDYCENLEKKLEEKDKRISGLQNELSRITKKYSECLNEKAELKIQLEGERDAVNTVSRFLNEEKLRHGETERKLQAIKEEFLSLEKEVFHGHLYAANKTIATIKKILEGE